mmetsp:Transcript_15457/g.38949  ORF Transcript_15457/g.38949 Transcript_15457/m.38949 type:complete len:422 (+) Transcript_15457:199-1464(+)
MIRSLSERFGLDSNADGNGNYFGRFSRRNLDSNRNIQRYDSDSSLDIIEDSDEGDDSDSEYTTVTVESNENEKTPAAASDTDDNRKRSTQVFVGSKTAKKDLEGALNDITKVSIFAKDVVIDQKIASNFLELVRGDNKSWEAMAVDILRQKARWNSIVLDTCSSTSSNTNESEKKIFDDSLSDMESVMGGTNKTATYLDLVLSGIVNVDNCAHLHLTGVTWSLSTSFALQSMLFSKSLTKLQLDFIDLSDHVPALAMSLSGNTSITCLIASRCGLLDDHLGVLLGQLPKGIEELRLFGNKCRAKGLASLTNLLQTKSRYSLKILDLSFQHIELHEKFDISWFCEALGSNKTLNVLDLDNDSLDDEHLGHIVTALCRNKTLEELKLNHNKISGGGVALMASKFSQMKGLKKISMYSNIFDQT